MKVLLTLFWQICLLRRPPEDVPYAVSGLWVLIGLNVLLSSLQLFAVITLAQAALRIALLLSVAAAFFYITLSLYGFAERFVQSFSAMLGCELILHVLILPFYVLQMVLLDGNGAQEIPVIIPVLFLLVALMLNVWEILITAHIFKHTLEVQFTIGLLLAFALLGMQILLYQWVLV